MPPEQLKEFRDKNGNFSSEPILGGKTIILDGEGDVVATETTTSRERIDYHKSRRDPYSPSDRSGRQGRRESPQQAASRERREQKKADMQAEDAAYKQELHATAKTASEAGFQDIRGERGLQQDIDSRNPATRQAALDRQRKAIAGAEARGQEAPEEGATQQERDAYGRTQVLNDRGTLQSRESMDKDRRIMETTGAERGRAFQEKGKEWAAQREAQAKADKERKANWKPPESREVVGKSGTASSRRVKPGEEDVQPMFRNEKGEMEAMRPHLAKAQAKDEKEGARINQAAADQAQAIREYNSENGTRMVGPNARQGRIYGTHDQAKRMGVDTYTSSTPQAAPKATAVPDNVAQQQATQATTTQATTTAPRLDPFKRTKQIAARPMVPAATTQATQTTPPEGTPLKAEMNTGTDQRPITPIGHPTRKAVTNAANTNAQDVLNSARTNLRTPVRTHNANTSSIDGRRLRAKG
jgi:hypothetical protein